MRTIYKYPLRDVTETIALPLGARVVYVDDQAGSHAAGALLTIWVELDTEQPKTDRTFRVVGTGHEIPPTAVYVGTTPSRNRVFVWHVYELVAA